MNKQVNKQDQTTTTETGRKEHTDKRHEPFVSVSWLL